MSLESYSKFAGAVSLIGLLSFTLGLAQQEQAKQMPTLFIGADAPHQLEGSHRPGVNPGASPVKQAATPSDEASERMAKASEPTRAPAAPEPQLIASLTRAKVSKPTPLDKAYLDAFSILREDGACSRFYGGPQVIEVLNKLTLQLKPIFLDRTIALRMKGKISVATNYASGLSYRLFEKAELNLDGPFYAATVLPNGPRVLGIGRFFP